MPPAPRNGLVQEGRCGRRGEARAPRGPGPLASPYILSRPDPLASPAPLTSEQRRALVAEVERQLQAAMLTADTQVA